MIPCTDAIIIWSGTTENSAKFRVTTPIKEVLERLMQRWGSGMIIDNEGFEVTPSSPHLQPGLYEYKGILPGGMPYPSALAQDLSACPPNTRQAGDAEQCDKAKSGRPESLACSIIDDMTTPACNTLWQEESTVGMQHLFWFYAECTRKWQQLWSLPVSQSRKVE
ncbi:TPA: hypothetical protein ACH3X1_006903 [Trebouxia sp. C0004]